MADLLPGDTPVSEVRDALIYLVNQMECVVDERGQATPATAVQGEHSESLHLLLPNGQLVLCLLLNSVTRWDVRSYEALQSRAASDPDLPAV